MSQAHAQSRLSTAVLLAVTKTGALRRYSSCLTLHQYRRRRIDNRGACRRTAAIQFTGSGSEYFKIWIVNVLLTIVTLGIYSAWAKVRRLRYFYNNTRFAGSKASTFMARQLPSSRVASLRCC